MNEQPEWPTPLDYDGWGSRIKARSRVDDVTTRSSEPIFRWRPYPELTAGSPTTLRCLATQLLMSRDSTPRHLYPTPAYEIPSAAIALHLYRRAHRTASPLSTWISRRLGRMCGAANSTDKEATVPDDILRYFRFEHLSDDLRLVSKRFADLAVWVSENLPAGPERSVALRKLLEGKDAAVRASLK